MLNDRMDVDKEEPVPFPPVLIPELLGFTPQLLLDDIANVANQSVEHTISAMEKFIERWAEEYAALPDTPKDWDPTLEVEQGLAAFATLLEAHTDFAFDSLESWSLRNIFTVPTGLSIVAPHHKGLDLTVPSGRQEELEREIEELRSQIAAQRSLNRLYSRAVIKTATQRQRSEQRRAKIASFLRPELLETFRNTPSSFMEMFKSVSSLGPPVLQPPLPQIHEGTRGWERSKTGYTDWAVGELVANGSDGKGDVGGLVDETGQVGRREVIKAALERSGV